MPNYSILVDTRDRLTPQLTYVPEENIEVISNMKVKQTSGMAPCLFHYDSFIDSVIFSVMTKLITDLEIL